MRAFIGIAALAFITACGIFDRNVVSLPAKFGLETNHAAVIIERPLGVPTNAMPGDIFWVIDKLLGAKQDIITDEWYERPTKDNWKSYFPTNQCRTYVTNRWDCDDYAIWCWNNARVKHANTSTNETGIAIGVIGYETPLGGHAANIIFLDSGDVFVWDHYAKKSMVPSGRVLFVWW